MRRKILIGCSFVLAMPVFFFLVASTTGFLLPKEHSVSLTAVIPADRQTTWALMTDLENISEWNPIVMESVLKEPVDGKRVWRETDPGGGEISFREVEADPPSRWVTEVFDPEAPYAGQWVYTLGDEGEGRTRLTIAETGTVHKPFLRFLMRFIVGYDRFQRTYFESVADHFGEENVNIELAPLTP